MFDICLVSYWRAKTGLFSFIIGVAVFLSSCSNVPQVEQPVGADKSNTSETESSTEQYPEHPLTEDILYDFTLAEIAAQRGENKIAFEKYYALAKKTGDPRIVKSAVRIALISKNEADIRTAVSLWGELEPDNLEVQQVLAVALIGISQDDLAAKSLVNMLQLSANRADGMRRVNMILSQVKESERLYKLLEIVNKAFPEDYYSTLYEAKFSLKYGDFERAEKNILKALEYNPDDFTAVMLKINLLKRTSRNQEAEKTFLEAIPNSSDSSLIRLEYAKFLIENQKIKPAIKQLEIIANDSGEKGDILYAIGLLAMEVKAYDKADHFFKKLYALQDRQIQGAFLMGKLAIARKDNEAALHWFSKVLSGKYLYESVLHRAIILSDKKRFQEAIQVLDNHNEETGKNRRNQLRLKAEILNSAEKFQTSYDVYTEILNEDPKEAEVLYGRAMVAEKLGRIDLMEQDLLKIIEMNPKDGHALNALGYTLTVNTNRYDEAKSYIQRALEIDPNDMATIDSMGWILYKQGHLLDALGYLKRAYEMEHDPEIAAHYGEVLWKLENKTLAKEVWQKALQSFPTHPILKATTNKFLK